MTQLITTDLAAVTPGQRLKYIRTRARLTRAYLEETYQIPIATLKAWENGVAPVTEKGLLRCINMYRSEGIAVSKEWIQAGTGTPPKFVLNVGDYFAAELQYPPRTHKIRDGDSDDTNRMLREASYFKQSYPNSIILMVADDNMEPVYQPGDMVGGIFRPQADLESVVKKDCIVRLTDGTDLLRRVFKNSNGKTYNLACINPLPSTNEPIIFDVEIESAAPVIWHRMPDE